jgi:(5-formylfuran-3-yl)methyl phosphate synthase
VKLLISVIDAPEATEAVLGRADIVDVKDPGAGALGAASLAAIRAVREATVAHLPVSVALGDGPFDADGAVRAARLAAGCGAALVKLGLRNTHAEQAVKVFAAVRASLPSEIRVVVAGFADFGRAGSPDPLTLPQLAHAAGADGCLIDTAVKDGHGLLHWLDVAALGSFVDACRARSIFSALAGSLTPADLPVLARLRPDVIGVRGAACDGDRVSGRVRSDRVARLAALLRGDDDPFVVATASFTERSALQHPGSLRPTRLE